VDKCSFNALHLVRVLQHRSVAFVTYDSELSAQFAKEAMACQSLDNDEILNVRWATEDPNPTTKVIEKRRLEEWGQEAISKKLQEGGHEEFVDAVRSIKALEDGIVLSDEGGLTVEDASDEPQAKKRKLNSTQSPPSIEQQKATGLLSADTLEGLRYFAEIRKRNGAAVSSTSKGGSKALGGLLEYGSDPED
jgi:pre-mRNA-splicing factor CWC2